MTNMKLQPHLPGFKELTQCGLMMPYGINHDQWTASSLLRVMAFSLSTKSSHDLNQCNISVMKIYLRMSSAKPKSFCSCLIHCYNIQQVLNPTSVTITVITLLPSNGRKPFAYIQHNDQAPIPLTVFRSNSKFDHNLKCCSLRPTPLITTKVTLSWHVQNFVVISREHFNPEHFKFWSNFEFDHNIVSGMGQGSV